MQTTLKAIYIALQTAPLIALAFTLPHTALCYGRDKVVKVRRESYTYIFVLYFLCAYFMTMLPFPSRESFADMRPVSELIQLVPFQNFFDIKAKSFFHDVAILVFNVFLTVPLGFFLRFLFGFSLKKTVLAGFLTALLYEITQLTGIFFIYPRPYRIFDVDDLTINTLGAFIGYLSAGPLSRILPDPDDSARQLLQGSEVAFFQRAVASLFDFGFVFCASVLTVHFVLPLGIFRPESGSLLRFPAFYLLFLFLGLVYASILPGGTPGCRLAGLRLMTKGGVPASRLQCALRCTMIETSVFAIPFWVHFFMTVNRDYAGIVSVLWVFLGTLLMMCAAAILVEIMFNAVTHGSSMYYDRLLKTYMAYGRSRKSSLFGIRVIDIRPLTKEDIDLLSAQVCDTLLTMGVSHKSVTRVRLMAEGVMLDWIAAGLENTPCELRLDRRFRRKTLMLSVSGEDRSNSAVTDSYASMLSGLDLKLETYYAAEKNICNILIP